MRLDVTNNPHDSHDSMELDVLDNQDLQSLDDHSLSDTLAGDSDNTQAGADANPTI